MIKAIAFFCGAGGLTRGLLDAGISVVAGVDNDVRLWKTYEFNNKTSRFIGAAQLSVLLFQRLQSHTLVRR